MGDGELSKGKGDAAGCGGFLFDVGGGFFLPYVSSRSHRRLLIAELHCNLAVIYRTALAGIGWLRSNGVNGVVGEGEK